MSDKKRSFFIKNTKLAADFYIALIVIIIGIVFIAQSAALPDKDIGIGPGDYPTVISYILIFLGVVQACKSLMIAHGFPIPEGATIDKKGLFRVAVMVVATYIFYKLLKIVGFPILAPIYLFGAICFFGYKKYVKAAILSVVFTTVVYILFTKVFLVMLPAGLLG